MFEELFRKATVVVVHKVAPYAVEVQQAIGARTNWSSPITWAIWLPLLIFELAFAAVLLGNTVAISRCSTFPLVRGRRTRCVLIPRS